MAFAREQAGGRVEPDPARAGQEDLCPGVQIGEILVRTHGPIERFHIGRCRGRNPRVAPVFRQNASGLPIFPSGREG